MTSRNPSAPQDPAGTPRAGPDTTAAPKTSEAPAAPAESPEPAEPPRRQAPVEGPSRRPWGVRRATAAVAAALLLLGAGALLFEAVWIRTGHDATAWWKRLTDEFATRPVDDVWILTGAAVAAALGLWLVVLALTPGLRRRLPLRVPADSHGRTSAELDRKGAALLLRDAAMRVPGVSAARVRVSRRHVKVRADVSFRDPAEIKDELTDAVRREEHDRLALARPPRPTVLIRPGPT
ncbi:DUF6286 domain-containing protein [Streptomyces sp. NBC_01613]|uniref:DUF6286 domain-containing protein n=1 Tax=Streptomyces sp. NBC_01613 TaxID=2975896 RepID=UPI0038657973